MNRSLTTDLTKDMVGQQLFLQGWVDTRRDHGGLIFVDLRDHRGILQLVINPSQAETFALAEELRDEFVIEVSGSLSQREPAMVNPNLATGELELKLSQLKILNRSAALPIPVNDKHHASEDNRLKYRYLDLRRPYMQEVLRKRARYIKLVRNFMDDQGFLEVSTPILANSSPEGARDFLVPSRIHPGQFYALPQAPQQFKQLLMVGGLDKYYQIATCFRDEDPRADRLYGDFYQLDLEMAFVEDGQVIRSLTEPLIKQLVEEFASKKLLNQKIPTLSYQESVDRYGSDKPDIRFEMQLHDLSQTLKDCQFKVFREALDQAGVVKAICVPERLSRSQLEDLTKQAQTLGAGGLPYMLMRDDQLSSAITKFFSNQQLKAISDQLKVANEQTILFALGTSQLTNQVLGNLRSRLGKELKLASDDVIAPVWIIDFPFYELDPQTNKLDFGHNPFSMPKGGLEVLESEDKLAILADQFDLAINGYEVCSGAIRNHNPDIMYKVFDNLGYDRSQIEAKFGAMLNAFKYGAPPHGGCAFGLDRLLMILLGEDNIRNLVAFPKNGSGVDVMMGSPSEIEPAQRKELAL